MSHRTVNYGHFCDIFAYFGQSMVAMATSLRPMLSEMSSLDWSTTKTPFISNHILVICGRNAFIAILVLKLVAMVMPLCPLCMWVSQMNSPTAQALSQNQTMHGYVAQNWSYGHFCDIFAYFGQNLVAMAMSLRPLQSEKSSLDWSIPKAIPQNEKFCQ